MFFSYCRTPTVILRSRKKPFMSLLCQAEAICTREKINCLTEINVLNLTYNMYMRCLHNLGKIGSYACLAL
jgi:hypothetical protein